MTINGNNTWHKGQLIKYLTWHKNPKIRIGYHQSIECIVSQATIAIDWVIIQEDTGILHNCYRTVTRLDND
jgi:hypothetical protein